MKWKRVKGTKLVKDKVDGQLKPIMAPNITSTNASSEIDDSQRTSLCDLSAWHEHRLGSGLRSYMVDYVPSMYP